jgi:pimeloyl-ACP methyl ester carboxylesterase
MSAPFAGPPELPFNTANEPARGAPPASPSIHDDLAKLPTYYIMDLDNGMAETVAPEMPFRAEIEACKWLTDTELQTYSGRTIDVPSCFIAGAKDWGPYQIPGNFEKMQTTACTRMLGVHFVDHAGHWVQQEQAEATTRLLLEFIHQARV